MAGPVAGGLAVFLGRPGLFALVGALAALLAVVSKRFTARTQVMTVSLRLVARTHRARPVFGGLWLSALPGLLFGALVVLAPLRIDQLGWGQAGVAGTFLAAAAVGVLARPLVARWADQSNPLMAVRLLLVLSAPVTAAIPWLENPWALSICVVFAATMYGVIQGPAMMLLSHSYDRAGIAQALGFALVCLTIGTSNFVGSAGAGEIADLAGDATAFSLLAAATVATAGALTLHARRRLPSVTEVAGA
jgi:hypothetical protein